jgi:hypothetical protein
VKHKLDVLRRHCDAVGRDFREIETSNVVGLLLARDEASLAAKREWFPFDRPTPPQALTVPQAVDLVGRYEDAGIQLFISSAYKNDPETHQILASDVMPHFQ